MLVPADTPEKSLPNLPHDAEHIARDVAPPPYSMPSPHPHTSAPSPVSTMAILNFGIIDLNVSDATDRRHPFVSSGLQGTSRLHTALRWTGNRSTRRSARLRCLAAKSNTSQSTKPSSAFILALSTTNDKSIATLRSSPVQVQGRLDA